MAKQAGLVENLSILNSIAATMENADKPLDTTEAGAKALRKMRKKIARSAANSHH